MVERGSCPLTVDVTAEQVIKMLKTSFVFRISIAMAIWGRAVLSREVLLDVIGKFMHLEVNEKKQDVMIFPRFQQLGAVRKLIDHARVNGTGHNYLIQHSAGSGKSNTIGWTAHQAINLHDESDQPIFNTAIIVTDRVVLDRQLQNTVSQFEQTTGVVKKIDGTSKGAKRGNCQGCTDHCHDDPEVFNRSFEGKSPDRVHASLL